MSTVPIIAVASQKGGSGKTTTTACLADAWAREGLRVLMVDADPQGSLAAWHARSDETPDCIAASPRMLATLRDVSPDRYDLIIIDCPPHADETARAALAVCELVLLTVRPTPHDLDALGNSVALLREARDAGAPLAAAILITQSDPRSSAEAATRDALAPLGLPVLRASVGFRASYPWAAGEGRTPLTYAPKSKAAREVRTLAAEVLAAAGLDYD